MDSNFRFRANGDTLSDRGDAAVAAGGVIGNTFLAMVPARGTQQFPDAPHQSEVAARRHHTDGGGDSDHVFALCSLLGFQFAPRIPELKSRRLYSFGKAAAYPSLEPLIAGRINTALIRAHWPEILRVAASIHTGTVAASLILRQLASYPRQNGLAAALRELGRLERTLFTLDWLGMRNCAVRPAGNSTRAKHATA